MVMLTQLLSLAAIMLWIADARTTFFEDFPSERRNEKSVYERLQEFCKKRPAICKEITGLKNKRQKEDSQMLDKDWLSDNVRQTVEDLDKKDQLFTQHEANKIVQNVINLLGYCIHNRAQCPLLKNQESIHQNFDDTVNKRANIEETVPLSIANKFRTWCMKTPDCKLLMKKG